MRWTGAGEQISMIILSLILEATSINTGMGAFVKVALSTKPSIGEVYPKKNILPLYLLVKFGEWSLTHRFTEYLLGMVESDESDQDETDGFLAELLGLAPLTSADTARILAVSPFNIHRYRRNAPVVNSLVHSLQKPSAL